MKRRNFLRTATGLISAVVFTSAGWLMGTRSLGMGTPPPPPSPCTQWCQSHWGQCNFNSGCQSGTTSRCNTVNIHYYSYSGCTNYDCITNDVVGICQCLPCLN
jgi:hypothetical protein